MMFKRRVKKQYPPGTFIPTLPRACAIVQLSLAFIVILWNLSHPYMGELVEFKSQLLLYKDVMGVPSEYIRDMENQTRLARNAERFESLPHQKKEQIVHNFKQLEELSKRSFVTKLKRSLHILLFEIPTFEQSWLILSLIIPVLLLKRIEGVERAIWLLPLLTACYAVDNYLYGAVPSISAYAQIFPKEEVIVANYLDEPLSIRIFEQREQLLKGWKKYLAKEWADHDQAAIPLNTSINRENRIENGEFAFNLARIQATPVKDPANVRKRPIKEPFLFIAIYLIWNGFFAYSAFASKKSWLYPVLSVTHTK